MFSEQHAQQIMDLIRVSVSIDYILELVVMAKKSKRVKVREISCLTDSF